jgi:hypothetical protein
MQLTPWLWVNRDFSFSPFTLAINTWQSWSLGLLDDAHSLSCQINANPESFREEFIILWQLLRFDGCSVLFSDLLLAWPLWRLWLV